MYIQVKKCVKNFKMFARFLGQVKFKKYTAGLSPSAFHTPPATALVAQVSRQTIFLEHKPNTLKRLVTTRVRCTLLIGRGR